MDKNQSLSLKYWGKITLFALIYFGCAQLGFLIPFAGGQIATLIWPATAVALAILLLYNINLWPGVTLGAILVAVSNHHSLPLLLGIVVTHTAEILGSAWLIRRAVIHFDHTLKRLSDVRTFVLIGAVLGPAIGATLGVISFAISPEGANKSLLNLWWQWWAGHAMSTLIITPAFLTWFAYDPIRRDKRQFVDVIAVYGAFILVAFLVFFRLPFSTNTLPLGHVVFPFLLWLAFRFTPREVAGASLIVTIMAMIGTVHGTGPFSRPNMATNLVLLLTFVVSVMLTTLILSSIMTERRRAQRLLQEKNNMLELRVAERTADLSQANLLLQQENEERKQIEKELAQARDQAMEALRLKTQILANVSHDARTPLNIIILYTEILQTGKHGELSAKQVQILETVLVSARELLHFINNLLDEAQLQTQKAAAKLVNLDIQQWLAERAKVLIPLADQKGLQLNLEVDTNMPAIVTADPEGLIQVFNNLVDNAIKFTSAGTVAVKIFKMNEENWAIGVTDTGPGIPKEAYDTVFEAFWQVDGSSTREVNRGVGLGLSIVKQRLSLLGGSIDLYSEPGQGSTFTAVIPFTREKTLIPSG
jgi:signal transduction histidine kinase